MAFLFRLLNFFSIFSLLYALPSYSNPLDGFVAGCTSNQDGTGDCQNNETGLFYSCLVVPGQVIDCTSKFNISFQCVAISGSVAGFSEFWCDPQVDKLLNTEPLKSEANPSLSLYPDSTSSFIDMLNSSQLSISID